MRKNPSAPIVVSYLRFSTAEQLKGDSQRRQIELADDWCKRNGVKLTERLEDLGISAYRGKNATKGALSAFLELVEAGKIPKGSTLLVEELDRLSRAKPEKAVSLFLDLITSGVRVVTLSGMPQTFEPGKLDMGGLMGAVMRLCQAHFESEKKSERLGKAWAQKRRQADTKKLTTVRPAWLDVAPDGKGFVVNGEKASIVRRIFLLAIEGHGIMSIAKKINSEHGGIGRKSYIQKSYIFKTLNNRAVLGEYQPHKLNYVEHEGKTIRRRTAEGEALPSYYPAIVDEKTFALARHALQGRRNNSGGPSSRIVNMLQGIITDMAGEPLYLADKGRGYRYYSSVAQREDGEAVAGIPIKAMEVMVLMYLSRFLDFNQQPKGATADNIDLLKAQLADTRAKRAELKEAYASGKAFKDIFDLMGVMEAREAEQMAALEAKQAEDYQAPAADAVQAALEAIEDIAGDSMSDDQRTFLRSQIRRYIRTIRCGTERIQRTTQATIEIEVMNGNRTTFRIAADDRLRDVVAMQASDGEAVDFVPLGPAFEEQEPLLLASMRRVEVARLRGVSHFSVQDWAEKIGRSISGSEARGVGFKAAAWCRANRLQSFTMATAETTIAIYPAAALEAIVGNS